MLFSVTNKLHEVFQGMLELVGPPAATGRSPIQPAAPARSNGLRPALAEAKPQSLNLSAKLAPGQTSTTEPFTKSVVLTGATNELINAATDLRVARMHTDSTLLPGEMLVAMTTLPDGRTVDSSTTFFIQRRGNSVRTSCYFSWGLADSFSPEDFDSAVTQIRQKTTGRPIELAQGSPVELFAVSNKVGGIVRGLLRYERLVAETASGTPGADTNAQATVRLRPYGGGLLAFYSASVPRGYFLEATDYSSELGEGVGSS
ncbi:MAG: hypothetical protein NT154_21110 [Verrucomicrobia bacterium]|nr:hypothetical protein [Verrucomicrobiota bacterium]